VKGKSMNPLFTALKKTSGKEPGWNFYKYLVSQDGKTVSVYPSETTPEQLESIVQGVLK
jgi:glutathione peroxidase